MMDQLSITILINGETGNVPMVYNSACSAVEIAKIDPLIRSVLPHYERKVDMLGSSVSNNFSSWGIDSGHSNFV